MTGNEEPVVARARARDEEAAHQIVMSHSHSPGGIVDVSCNCLIRRPWQGKGGSFGTVFKGDPPGQAWVLFDSGEHALTNPPFKPGDRAGAQSNYVVGYSRTPKRRGRRGR